MKFLPLLLSTSGLALANTAPTVVIKSAQMRPGTTLLDVVYRVDDPDDATVKTRALAFVDGVRSFANVIRPVSFFEGTGANLGDSISSNTDHTLTWDVAADWNIDLGQVKFEVLAMDGRGLLPFEWITIPEANGEPTATVSVAPPTDNQLIDAFLWKYADSDAGISLANGVLSGNANSGVFDRLSLVEGGIVKTYAAQFIYKIMDLDVYDGANARNARADLDVSGWRAARRPYVGTRVLIGFGPDAVGSSAGLKSIPRGLSDVASIKVSAGHCLALRNDGTVVRWGPNSSPSSAMPDNLSGVIAIDSCGDSSNTYSLALKSDGTVVGWGSNIFGQINIPSDLSGVVAIAGGSRHGLALKNDGTVVGWGNNTSGQVNIPEDLEGVVAIDAGFQYSLLLKSDGTVIKLGSGLTVPQGLSEVVAISAGSGHALALKSDGTVVGWGNNTSGQINIPEDLGGVVAIAAGATSTGGGGASHSLALKSDGTVVGWGDNVSGQISIPSETSGVVSIAAGYRTSILLKSKDR